MPADSNGDRRIAWLARLGATFVRALASTWRFRVTNDGGFERLRSERKPIIFVLWHGQMLPLLYHHRGQGVAVLISEHGDGEIIARIAKSLGFETVRGSTSRGAARALLGLGKILNEGRDLAITPDGPRGPAKSFAPGPLIIAHRTGAPVVAVGVSCNAAWHLGSWDRFMIPRPFARVDISYSDPVYVAAADTREASSADEAEKMRQVLVAAEQRAHG